MEQELSATLEGERVIIDGYLNGHTGRREGIERVHGGWDMREIMETGTMKGKR